MDPPAAVLRRAARALRERAGDADAARLEAELLLAHALGIERRQVWTLETLPARDRVTFEALVERRVAQGEPLAYLTGSRGFYDLEFAVDPRVLVPRPETELLVERLLELEADGRVPDGPWADWGTGSGCVAAVLARRRPVLAIDLSAAALDAAGVNLARIAPARAVLRVRADGLCAVGAGSLAAVAANPPYVPEAEWRALDVDVREHEPRTALVPADGDVAGLYGRLAQRARTALVPGGWLLAEVGAGQAEGVRRAWEAAGLVALAVHPDLAGIPRLVEARRPL